MTPAIVYRLKANVSEGFHQLFSYNLTNMLRNNCVAGKYRVLHNPQFGWSMHILVGGKIYTEDNFMSTFVNEHEGFIDICEQLVVLDLERLPFGAVNYRKGDVKELLDNFFSAMRDQQLSN